VFGVSDGLVSNTALVMGFAGAATNNSTVLFAGLAGLLAGAFSMAAGEYVSVASQRDLFQREIAMEASELRDKPEEEQKELELIYRAKGVDRETAASLAAQIMSDPTTALDTLAREELGLDPDELGSPMKAAIFSFVAFAIGASVVVIPYLFFMGEGASTTAPLIIAVVLAVISMLVVGGIVGRLSGRGVVFSAMRQLLWGAGAAIVTYAVGSLVGISVG
jgi:VIT1/CCC1 family predicted Fe2+/Mn2+ transporter